MPLDLRHSTYSVEAGVDEAGRGCLAGPVVAAAVILPEDFHHSTLNDSKQLSHKQRLKIRKDILANAISWNIGMISAPRIDQVNILNATYEAMHEAIQGLPIVPDFLCIDGNRFRIFSNIPHACIVRGDGKYLHIAAASILAKTYRDEIMGMMAEDYPQYGWERNKGYPTRSHKEAMREYGITRFHRKSFKAKFPSEGENV